MSYSALQACGSRSPEPKLQMMGGRSISSAAGIVLGLAGSSWVALLACKDDTEHLVLVCPTLSSQCPEQLPSYSNDIAPLLAAHCAECHTRDNPGGPWPLEDPLDVAEWASSIEADVSQCLMPPADAQVPLSDADRETLHAWLSCGAPLD